MEDVEDTARRQLGWYVRNCVHGSAAGMLETIMLQRLNRLKGVADNGDTDVSTMDLDETPRHNEHRRRRLRELRRVLKNYADPPTSDEYLERNALFARDEFGLDAIETEILLLLLRYERNSDLELFADEVMQVLHSASRALAALIGISRQEARRRLKADSTLISSGVLYLPDGSGAGMSLAGHSEFLQLAQPLRKVMHQPYGSREDWVAAIVGQPLATPLTWEDFEHLGTMRELAAQLLAGAGRQKAKGVNLLLHGPVGTGKTEFCKALATRAGMNLWSVGEADEEGGEPGRGERLASLRLAQRFLAQRADAVILFDEAEDVLEEAGSCYPFLVRRERIGSKAHLNRMLEQNPVPVLWTCNETDSVDPAILRRMVLALEVKTPNEAIRARIWRRVLSEAHVALDDGAVRRLSQHYAAPPAIAANAARAAALAGGGEAEIEAAMAGVLKLVGLAPGAHNADGRDFDPELVNCREDLNMLVERLARHNAPRRWSLCVHGAPGTGKSLFARYLAFRLGMEVAQHRASDLLSCWLGGSEKNIVAAFQAARAQRALLVIDEAESLLCDRRDAVRSWEITQVNEMLTWMESHPLPFMCTTNLMDRFDSASLRRFTLKLRFEALTSDQAAFAFERFFGLVPCRPLPHGLTPGDFAIVRRKQGLFGPISAAALADWLDEEAEAKGAPAKAIGFVAGHH